MEPENQPQNETTQNEESSDVIPQKEPLKKPVLIKEKSQNEKDLLEKKKRLFGNQMSQNQENASTATPKKDIFNIDKETKMKIIQMFLTFYIPLKILSNTPFSIMISLAFGNLGKGPSANISHP